MKKLGVTGILTIGILISNSVISFAETVIESNYYTEFYKGKKHSINDIVNTIDTDIDIILINSEDIINISQNTNVFSDIDIDLFEDNFKVYKDEKGTFYISVSFLKKNQDINLFIKEMKLNMNNKYFTPYLIDNQVFVTEKSAKIILENPVVLYDYNINGYKEIYKSLFIDEYNKNIKIKERTHVYMKNIYNTCGNSINLEKELNINESYDGILNIEKLNIEDIVENKNEKRRVINNYENEKK